MKRKMKSEMERKMNKTRRGANRRPRAIMYPDGWDRAETRAWLEEIETTWSALATYGEARLEEGLWRRLGIGAVHAEAPGFWELARPMAVCWATLDATDGWGQSVIDIASRQRHWFTPQARPILAAASRSCFDLYFVESSTRAPVVLRRLRDGRRLEVHASMSEAAHPAGTTVVARVLEMGDARLVLASAVVDEKRARDARRTYAPTTVDGWSQMLFDLCMERFTRCASQSRGDVVEAELLDLGAATIRRIHRAYSALERAFTLRPDEPFRYCDQAGRALRASLRGTLEVAIEIEPMRTVRVHRLPAPACSAFDRELTVQAGFRPQVDGVVIAEQVAHEVMLRRRDVDVAAQVCARAALAIIGERRAAA